MNQESKKILNIIKCLSFAGILVAGYSLYEYYLSDGNALCDINSMFSCSAVYGSGYSAIFGIPVSLFGIIGFGAMFICAALSLNGKNVHKFILPMISAFAVSTLYFVYISALVINVWCVACITSWVIIWLLLVLSIKLKKISKSSSQAIQ